MAAFAQSVRRGEVAAAAARNALLEWAGNRAIRQGDWKLVWDKQVKEWELYDLSTDRTETDDLARKNPGHVAQMSDDWNAWAKRRTVQ